MKRKGFTLVELLGVIVILAIVLGIAVVGYLSLNGTMDKIYYKSVEESMVIPGSDYFTYNKGEQPSVFGDEVRVSAKLLKEGGYIDNELVDSKGNSCDLENSYIGAYKDSKDKTNYYTCLSCGGYKTESLPCSGAVSYNLGIRANGKNSKAVYDIKLGRWINENIVLTFETLNDMTNVILEDSSNRQVGTCELKTQNNIKTCTIEVSSSGDYQAYAKKGDVVTRNEDIKIQIDKTNPTFDIVNTGTSNKIELDIGSSSSLDINNEIKNINDSESKVKTIEYSFEKVGQPEKYQAVSLATSFKVNKSLGLGSYNLIVRVTNNASGVTTKKVSYEIYKKISTKPSAEGYCLTGLEYNGSSQTVTKTPPTGVTFSNNKGTNAGTYKVVAKLASNYRYSDNTSGDINFECQISKKKVDVNWNVGSYTYNGNQQGPSATATGVNNETLNLTTTKETNTGDYTSKATLTSVSGGQKNVNNYELTNTSVNYKIKKASSNLTLTSTNGEVKSNDFVSVTATAKVEGTFTNTVSNDNVEVVPSSQTGSSETITITGKVSGTSDITIKFVPNNNNYETESKTYKLTITTVGYTINYWQMNNDKVNYTLVQTVTGEGSVGSELTGELVEYDNFKTPDPITITLDADETKNVIDYYYKKICFGATCDYCALETPLGQCLYDNRTALKLWSSGLSTDTSKQIIRYIGSTSSQPKNYITFGDSTHRIIGVFGTNHQVRLIRTGGVETTYWRAERKTDVSYNVSNLKSKVNAQLSKKYNKTINSSTTTKYSDLLAKFTVCGTSANTTNKTEPFLNREHWDSSSCGSARIATVTLSPTWISDYLLSKGNKSTTITKGTPSNKLSDSWMQASFDEWSFLFWNSAHAFYIEKTGRICNNNNETSNCTGKSGYIDKARTKNYRLTSQLKEKVLFCGGSGTSSDPYKIGWGNCPV